MGMGFSPAPGTTSSASRSPQPALSLASVSEAASEEEDNAVAGEADGSDGKNVLHAPRGIVPIRPVFVNGSVTPSTVGTPPPISAMPLSIAQKDVIESKPAPASTLSRADLMRGFGMESADDGIEEEDVQDLGSPDADSRDVSPKPIVDNHLLQEIVDQANEVDQEGELADPAEDADEEDASVEESEAEMEEDNYTTPSHSRHVSKASVAPSLLELGGSISRATGTFLESDHVQEVDEGLVEDAGDRNEEVVTDDEAMSPSRVLDGDLEVVDGVLQEWTGSEEGHSDGNHISDTESAVSIFCCIDGYDTEL